MNKFLKSRRLYMLFVLPFLVMAITFMSAYFPRTPMNTVRVKGCIDITFINDLDKLWVSVVGFFVVLGVAYMIFFINDKFKLLHQTTTLPSLIYVLLTSGIMVNLGFNYLLIAIFILALAVERLQVAINDTKSNHVLFDFGALVALAVAIYPKFILLIAWVLVVLFFSGRSTLKDIMAVISGVCTPVVFIIFYYFWNDNLQQLPDIFVQNLLIGEPIHQLPAIEWARLGMLSFLLLIALFHLSTRYSILIVSRRRGILSFVSMLIFLMITIFIIPGNYYDFMYLIALPLAFIYAQYFLTQRSVIFGNLMFILLLSACFLTYLV